MADSDPMMLGMDLPEAPAPNAAPTGQAYRVLARKYRPQTFAELIGQEAMVRTLGNAIKRDRIAHAFLLTGVRGVGKTSTARLIAKALNCIGPDGQSGPTIDPCNLCEPCRAIAEGRHIDVIEMDAASNTGVDDVREIIDAVRYSAVSARYKVYIVDEVHMLSKNAFNALLKTLEEPPPHVKFLFATTEVNKVPVTVLSRCQRFDLRRIPAERLTAHFADIARAEQAEVEPGALALIARAAEGSARDGLSILDQAIAHGSGAVTADQVRAMLGLSDRGAVRALLGLLLAGDAPGALAALKDQYELGVEPPALLRSLLEAVHGITRVKVGGGARDPAQSEEEREAYADWAARLSFPVLHRLWQLLLKGLDEVARAPLPLEAAEMALLRVIHASQLPDPGELAASLASGRPVAAPSTPSASSTSPATSQSAEQGPPTFAAMVELLDRGHAHLAQQLHDFAGLVAYAPPELALKLDRPLPNLARDLSAALKAATGTAWRVRIADEGEEAAPTLLEQEQAARARLEQEVLASPMVKAALEAFPDAELAGYTAGNTSS
jgi:DNA polymerase-3 subunit gamma/tau